MTGIHHENSPYSWLRRDADRGRYLNQQAQTYTQVGKVLIIASTTADESTVDVTFSNVFIEEPVFLFGSVLDVNQPAVSGSFPTASATVIDWDLEVTGPFNAYLGATLGIVTTGISTQQLWIHYSFTGKALAFNAGQIPTSGTTTA